MNNKEYGNLMQQLRKQVKQKDGTIEKLQKRINDLVKEVSDLHAAANDTETELLLDADVWKHQALTFKAENERLTSNLLEVRKELNKSKGENVLFRAVIKEVII